MSTKITISYQKKNYELEFSRTTAGQIEDQGFVLDQMTEKPLKMIPLLFYGAFLKHNRGISRKLVDEMETLTARDAWPMPTYGDITFRL